MKLKELFDVWLNKYIKHTIKLRTYTTYQRIFDKHISPMIGDYELKELTSSVIQDFILFKTENGNLINGKALAYNTVNSIVSLLKQILKYVTVQTNQNNSQSSAPWTFDNEYIAVTIEIPP